MTMQERLVLSVAEVARLLGVSPWTVRAWEREGKLHGLRLGRLLKFKREEVFRLIESADAK